MTKPIYSLVWRNSGVFLVEGRTDRLQIYFTPAARPASCWNALTYMGLDSRVETFISAEEALREVRALLALLP